MPRRRLAYGSKDDLAEKVAPGAIRRSRRRGTRRGFNPYERPYSANGTFGRCMLFRPDYSICCWAIKIRLNRARRRPWSTSCIKNAGEAVLKALRVVAAGTARAAAGDERQLGY